MTDQNIVARPPHLSTARFLDLSLAFGRLSMYACERILNIVRHSLTMSRTTAWKLEKSKLMNGKEPAQHASQQNALLVT
jgi:hypothetical protein